MPQRYRILKSRIHTGLRLCFGQPISATTGTMTQEIQLVTCTGRYTVRISNQWQDWGRQWFFLTPSGKFRDTLSNYTTNACTHTFPINYSPLHRPVFELPIASLNKLQNECMANWFEFLYITSITFMLLKYMRRTKWQYGEIFLSASVITCPTIPPMLHTHHHLNTTNAECFSSADKQACEPWNTAMLTARKGIFTLL